MPEYLAGDVKELIFELADNVQMRTALEKIRALIDGGESGANEMAAMLLHIGRIVDKSLSKSTGGV